MPPIFGPHAAFDKHRGGAREPFRRWLTLPAAWLARSALPSTSAYAVLVPPPSTPRNKVAVSRPGMDGDTLYDAVDDARGVRSVGCETELERLAQCEH